MKLTILDGYALNPGDLDYGVLSSFGDVTVYDRTDPADIIPRIGDSELVLTNKTVIDRTVLDACPNIRYIGVLATGYNVVDVAAATRKGIIVTNIPAYASQTVAQHTFALLLELTNHVGLHSDSVKAGDWSRSPDFSYQLAPLSDLAGKTLGIVGFGSIGRAVKKIADAFGMRVLVSTRTPSRDADCVSFDTLLSESDVVTLHCPLTEVNAGMMNVAAFDKMKKGALLINTARGGLVDEIALCDALECGHLSGAALDVVSKEPIPANSPLLTARNLILTPHNAWASKEARQWLLDTAVENIRAFLAGLPVNIVNQK